MKRKAVYFHLSRGTGGCFRAIAASDRKKEKKSRGKGGTAAGSALHRSRLSMEMMDASLQLAIATALAVEQPKFNGELKWRKKGILRGKKYDSFYRISFST